MEKYCLSLLVNTEGLDYEDIKALLSKGISAADIWHASFDELADMKLSLDIAVKLDKARRKSKYDPETLQVFCDKNNIKVLDYKSSSYPKELLNIPNFPFVIFVKGNIGKDADRIAMVGSRKASSYGISVAKQFSADLAQKRVVIVSGGAKGIDTASHQGALSVSGQTVAVFGCGLDICYPKENKKLFDDIVANNGALVSEYIPGTEPIAWHFPARNRIISGLSRGVLVVEADKKSGSLITANFALEAGRDVYCVPGSIYSRGSIGVHNLIKQGAALVDRPDDILDDMGMLFAKARCFNDKDFCYDIKNDETLAENAKTVYLSMVIGKTYTFDDIISNTGLPSHKITVAVTELEMYGLLENNSGLYKCKERGGR